MAYFTLNDLKKRFNGSFEWNNSLEYLPSLDPNVDAFILNANKNNNLLYIGWIKQINGLEELICTGKTSFFYRDDIKLQEHSLFLDFQQFLSSYLSPVLLKITGKNIDYSAFSFIPLLQKDSRTIIEDQLYKNFRDQFRIIQGSLINFTKEDDLLLPVQTYLSEDNITLINLFSRPSYALKINYVEQALKIITHKACTNRLAYWIVKQLEKLSLNNEHIQKINAVKSDLKSGKLLVKNLGKRKAASYFNKTYVGSLVIILLISFTCWLIITKPWSMSDKHLQTTSSSYKSFTIDERKQIDSLLKIIQPSRNITPENYDLGSYLGEELDLLLRSPLNNVRAEQYHNDLTIYSKNYTDLKPDSCTTLSKKSQRQIIPKDMLLLSNKTNGKDAFFKNESDYDIQIIVFKNLKHSQVYYGYVNQGENETFKLDIGDLFFIVPGNKINTFNTPLGYYGEEVSDKFREAFCEIDVNFIHGLNSAYQLKSNAKQNYKFLILGSNFEQFELIDIHGVLKPI